MEEGPQSLVVDNTPRQQQKDETVPKLLRETRKRLLEIEEDVKKLTREETDLVIKYRKTASSEIKKILGIEDNNYIRFLLSYDTNSVVHLRVETEQTDSVIIVDFEHSKDWIGCRGPQEIVYEQKLLFLLNPFRPRIFEHWKEIVALLNTE